MIIPWINKNFGKFIQNLASLLHPLNQLLQTEKKWEWTPECSQAFQAAKDQLVSAEVLTHYNPELPLRMAADAAAYGIGAVISHVLSDGSERPISFASCTLTQSEKNYSQLEKEVLSLTFRVRNSTKNRSPFYFLRQIWAPRAAHV